MMSIFFMAIFCACCAHWTTGTASLVNEVSPTIPSDLHKEQECNPPRGKLQVSVENDFLFEKVVGMKEQIRIYSETFLEYEALTTKLTDLNSQMVAENTELKGQFDALNMANKELEATILRNSNHSNTALHETVRSLSLYAAELEKEVSWLQMENDDLQRTMDLLPLVCLSFNVIVLVFAFSEHFSFLFTPWKKLTAYLHNSMNNILGLCSESTITDCNSQGSNSSQIPGSLVLRVDDFRRYAMEIYQTTITTLSRAIVIAAS